MGTRHAPQGTPNPAPIRQEFESVEEWKLRYTAWEAEAYEPYVCQTGACHRPHLFDSARDRAAFFQTLVAGNKGGVAGQSDEGAEGRPFVD